LSVAVKFVLCERYCEQQLFIAQSQSLLLMKTMYPSSTVCNVTQLLLSTGLSSNQMNLPKSDKEQVLTT